ncbi:MAG: hypothetical protein OQK70_06695 [Gammaproteobacteria bacterium]|nr:hypothetical protein [Gammaproteobacteria bacterium]
MNMTNKQTVLLLYVSEDDQAAGDAMKQSLQTQGIPVEELLVPQNYAAVLDQLQQPVIPVVVN